MFNETKERFGNNRIITCKLTATLWVRGNYCRFFKVIHNILERISITNINIVIKLLRIHSDTCLLLAYFLCFSEIFGKKWSRFGK